MRRDWRRLTIGVGTGALVAVAGHLGLAVVGLYGDTIGYSANVGVFAYGEGRVQARAYWSIQTEESFEELYVVAASGVGALTDREGSASGSVDHQDPARSRPTSYDQSGEERTGAFKTFFAAHRGCNPNGCFDETIELRRGEGGLEFTFDPLLRRAEVHGFVDGQRFDIVWTSVAALAPGGFASTNHQVGEVIPDHPDWPYSGLAHRSFVNESALAEEGLGRFSDTISFSSTWAPTPDPGMYPFGDISYVAAARANSEAEAGVGPWLQVEEPSAAPTP